MTRQGVKSQRTEWHQHPENLVMHENKDVFCSLLLAFKCLIHTLSTIGEKNVTKQTWVSIQLFEL